MFDQLLSQAAGSALNSVLGGDNPWAKIAQQVLEESGGLPAIFAKFQEAGLEGIIQSWIAQAQNLPISVEQLQQVFSSTELDHFAQRFGVDTSTLLTLMSQFLPQLIDKLTPQGHI